MYRTTYDQGSQTPSGNYETSMLKGLQKASLNLMGEATATLKNIDKNLKEMREERNKEKEEFMKQMSRFNAMMEKQLKEHEDWAFSINKIIKDCKLNESNNHSHFENDANSVTSERYEENERSDDIEKNEYLDKHEDVDRLEDVDTYEDENRIEDMDKYKNFDRHESMERDEGEQRWDVKKRTYPTKFNSRPPRNLKFSSASGYKTTQRCFECHDMGHVGKNCPNKGLIKCYSCQKLTTHISKNCPERREHSGNEKSYDFKSSKRSFKESNSFNRNYKRPYNYSRSPPEKRFREENSPEKSDKYSYYER